MTFMSSVLEVLGMSSGGSQWKMARVVEWNDIERLPLDFYIDAILQTLLALPDVACFGSKACVKFELQLENTWQVVDVSLSLHPILSMLLGQLVIHTFVVSQANNP